jgi:hypothetical protein
MINNYVNKLIDNLPNTFKNNKTPLQIDLILDGGLFNGSYLVGALYFLKEMEKKNYIKINRISSCSIGSIIGFLYFIDYLDIVPKLYNIIFKHLKKKNNFNIVKHLKQILYNKIPNDILNKINASLNNKFYISYYNIKKGKKIIKYNYTNIDEVINTIIKSCFIPFLIDGNMLYNNQFIDGINPYIFKINSNKKILYLDLFGYDKIQNFINIKNEKTSFHRILSGLLDIHTFFIKEKNTTMCSYVNNWNFLNKNYIFLRYCIEKLCICIIYFIYFIKFYFKIDKSFINIDFIKKKMLYYFINYFCI